MFKETTYPFARATGKTPELPVYTFESKIPRIMDDFTDVQILKPSGTSEGYETSFTKCHLWLHLLIYIRPIKTIICF